MIISNRDPANGVSSRMRSVLVCLLCTILFTAVPATEVDRIVAGVEPAVFRPILARCLAGTVSPQVALMQMIEAIYKSSESGKSVEIKNN